MRGIRAIAKQIAPNKEYKLQNKQSQKSVQCSGDKLLLAFVRIPARGATQDGRLFLEGNNNGRKTFKGSPKAKRRLINRDGK